MAASLRMRPLSVPGRREIHLWTIDLDPRTADLPALARLLGGAELARLARLREPLKAPFVVAHGAVRLVLGAYLDVAPECLRFTCTAAGKPALADYPLAFNLAHSGRVAVCAVAADGRVGVDVEMIRRVPDAAELVDRYFAPAEATAFAQLPDTARDRAFLRMWTRKEAFMKLTGEGLQRPLDSFEVSIEPGAARLVSVDGAYPVERWSMRPFEPRIGYVGTVAYEGPIDGVVCRTWRAAERDWSPLDDKDEMAFDAEALIS